LLGGSVRAGVRIAARPATYATPVHVDPWAFGGDALAAFGTLALAAVGFFLAWSTRRLATETATEVHAQWRPILVPVEDSIQMFEKDLSQSDQQLANRFPSQTIDCRNVDTAELLRRQVEMTIRNIGRGPALDIQVTHL
jgi:hypothetical protein